MITHEELGNKLVELEKLDLFGVSAARERRFYEILNKIDFNIALEIGTHKGLSTVVLASKANMVYTFDVYDWKENNLIWGAFGVKNKIKPFILRELKIKDKYIENYEGWEIVSDKVDQEASNKLINEVIKNLDFDFALIDGWHNYKSVKANFKMVKKCGKVLFHDYKRYPEIEKFCDEIKAKPIGAFAYWEMLNGTSK